MEYCMYCGKLEQMPKKCFICYKCYLDPTDPGYQRWCWVDAHLSKKEGGVRLSDETYRKLLPSDEVFKTHVDKLFGKK
jgi:hypothetical protein